MSDGGVFIPTHPTGVIGDVVAGAAVVVSWSGYMHEWLTIAVTVMAAGWYLIQYFRLISHYVRKWLKK